MIATTIRSATRIVGQHGSRAALSSTYISEISSSSCAAPTIRCASSAALNNDAASPPPPNSAQTTTPHNIYMWGTSKQGTIPLSLLQEGGSASSGGMFSGNEKIIDHPMSLNLDQDALQSFLNTTDVDADAKLQQIFCGATGTAMVLNDGRCFVFGSNKNGELGIGQGQKSTETPVHVPLPDPVAKVSLGPNFSAFLTTTGDLYTCGYGGSAVNGMGCLGHGNIESYHSPKLVNSLVEDGCYASDVHCGEYSMIVLTTEGEVLTCGSGSYGRLGNVETFDQLYLEPVELIAGDDVVQIAGGFAFSLALNKGGIIHAWGRNNEGQLGGGAVSLCICMF